MREILDFMRDNNVTSVLDIGANVGHFSRVVKTVFPNMDIYMMEANPYCEAQLSGSGIPYKIACLSDEKKTVKLYLNPMNYICTGVSYYKETTHHYEDAHVADVETERLDDVLDGKTFEYIKMDTQGSELDILKGGPKTVESAKYIQLELSLMEYNKNAPLKDEMFEYMKSIGFEPKVLVENHYHQGELIQEDWIFTR